jgi:hypothetical protein
MFLISILSVYSVGCVDARVTASVKNTEYTDNKAFNNILVFANIDDLEKRKIIEDTFVEKFATSEINAYSSLKIVPPLKRYTIEELKKILRKNNIDSILVVYVMGDGLSVGGNQKTIKEVYDIISGEGYIQQRVRKQGDLPESSTTKWNVDLYDFVSEQIVWKAQVKTESTYATFKKIAKSLADEILNKMKKDKIILRRENN